MKSRDYFRLVADLGAEAADVESEREPILTIAKNMLSAAATNQKHVIWFLGSSSRRCTVSLLQQVNLDLVDDKELPCNLFVAEQGGLNIGR